MFMIVNYSYAEEINDGLLVYYPFENTVIDLSGNAWQ